MKKPHSDIQKLTQKILDFRNARNWQQFHKPKDVAISLSLEAAEVLEHFQWKSNQEIEEYIKNYKDHIAEELADVLWWVLLMSHDLKIDIIKALEKKIQKNAQKYPVSKSRGKHYKYTEF